jgi:hypothetical protein
VARFQSCGGIKEVLSMKIVEFFQAQLEREIPVSRRVLERVPEGRNDWKPHEKSMPLGYLSVLVATMPSWIAMAVNQDELDLNPPGGAPPRPPLPNTNGELLQAFDQAAAQGRDALRNTRDEHLATPWRLLVAGKVVMESPREVVISDTFGHMSHHRGQLTVYLRVVSHVVA